LILTRWSLSRAAAIGHNERGRQRNPENPHSVHCNNFHTARPLRDRVI
jgi:hypothetical protein